MGTTSLPFRRLLVSVLSIAICSIALHCHVALATQDEYAGVVTTHFMGLNPRAGSRFLAAAKKGDRCDPVKNNVCLGNKAKNGSQLLQCCKNHCRNVLSDRNHCGYCGHKCGFGQLCCRGKCTAVAYDVRNCGKCGTVCSPELRCEYGSCGYA
ncbi:protein GRIM REAPER-like [Musa acuminata AAA Group]|uniref:protein GRIM REAPER-like n=1 Tax=Musa acuminata AAA Group TaxID=214697 RepID=UPI0031D2326F